MSESISGKIQTDDWKNEKHVPAIDCPEIVKANEWVEVTVQIGREIPHPNLVEHHIRWIQVYFTPDVGKFTYDLGLFNFNSHVEGPVTTDSKLKLYFKTDKQGTLNAISYCNIHGLWESSRSVKII
jgi:superoxide reductase